MVRNWVAMSSTNICSAFSDLSLSWTDVLIAEQSGWWDLFICIFEPQFHPSSANWSSSHSSLSCSSSSNSSNSSSSSSSSSSHSLFSLGLCCWCYNHRKTMQPPKYCVNSIHQCLAIFIIQFPPSPKVFSHISSRRSPTCQSLSASCVSSACCVWPK